MPLALLQAMRPHQWVKNLLVFAPLVFKHRLDHGPSWQAALLAFVVFCMVASGIYLLNDVVDREADRRHPTKRNRPIASGRLNPAVATAVGALLMVAGIALGLTLGDPALPHPWVIWPLAYLLQNVAYSLGLKRIPILDCMFIAVGFMLRVHAGARVLPAVNGELVESSSWILMCTFFFSLFLAFCKRRDEVAKVDNAVGGDTRHALRHYDLGFLDQVIPALAGLSIMSYALWTVSPTTVALHQTENLLFTVPFVVYGVFRYLILVRGNGDGDDPARLLFRDPSLLATGVLYAAAVWILLGTGSL